MDSLAGTCGISSNHQLTCRASFHICPDNGYDLVVSWPTNSWHYFDLLLRRALRQDPL